MKKDKTGYFTVTNYGYLYKAIALKNSLKRQGIDSFTIFMFDDSHKIPENPYEQDYIVINESHHVDYLKLAFKYDVVEYTTSLKPTLTLKLLKEYDKVIFLDPDTYVYSSFEKVNNLLDEYDIVLTPHYIKPLENVKYPDLNSLKYGSFNLGFFAVNSSTNAINFLKWWEKRCLDQCYFETHNGLSTDQKWVVLANVYFDGINTLKDYGHNVSYWNSTQREITISESEIRVNGDKLVFIHFSSLIERIDSPLLSSRSNVEYDNLNNPRLWKKIYSEYIDEIDQIKPQLNLFNYQYSYDKLGSRYLTYTLRRFYGENMGLFNTSNPFQCQELISFAKKHRLTSKTPIPQRLNENKVSSKKLNLLVNTYRFILKLFGFQNDINISRLHIFLSSPHRIDGFFNYKKKDNGS